MSEFLPSGWKKRALGDVLGRRAERADGSEPLLSVTQKRGVIPQDEVGRRDSSSEYKGNYWRVYPGDIVYNTMRMWQGVSGVSGQHGIVSPAYTVCKPAADVDSKFLAYLLREPSVVNKFYRMSQGLVSDTWNLRYAEFSRIPVSLPPLGEQRRIAEILDALDSRFAVGVSIVQKLGLISQGMLHDFMSSYTGGVGKRGVQVRCSDGFRLASGRPYPAERSQGQGGVPIYGASGAFSYGDLSMTPGPTFTIGRVGEGSVGVVNYVPGEAWVTDNALWATWVHSDWSPKFIAYYLKWFNLRKVRSQTGQPLVTQTVISPLPLPRPSLEEQVRAVEVLDSVNSQMDQERTVLAKLSSLKQGLAEDLLTGRVRVPEAEAVVESL